MEEGAVKDMIFLKKRERIIKFFLCIEGERGKTVFVSLLYCPPFKKKKKKEQEPCWKTLKKRKKNQTTNYTGVVILDDPSPSINLDTASLLAGKDHFKHP